MKKLIIILFSTLLLTSCSQEEHEYCGVVIEKFRTDAGYKSNPQTHVVFYCDSLQRNIDVKVSFNTYANVYVGKKVCFSLCEYELSR